MVAPGNCPPCKVIICGGGITAPMRRMQTLIDNAIMLVNPANALNYDHQATTQLIDVMEEIEDEMEECAKKLEAAVKKLGRVS
jgi:hypothetical protein